MKSEQQMKNPVVVCMGEILIDFMGSPSGCVLRDASTFIRKPGGAPANVAVGISRLGMLSAFIGMVGEDAFGDFLRETLSGEGVDVRSLKTCKEQPTSLAFIAIDRNGVPSFSFYRHPGADQSIRFEDVEGSVFNKARVFHFGSLSLMYETSYETTLFCINRARERNMFITYDPNYRPALWSDAGKAREKMTEPLASVDLLKVSEEELILLSETDDLRKGCESLSEGGPGMIIVTRGSRGMSGWNRGEMIEVPGIEVEVVDTTGCGDASMAGVIVGLLEGKGEGLKRGAVVDGDLFRKTLEFANRCAAHAARSLGAIPSLPYRKDLE